jgi:hypothetical protein
MVSESRHYKYDTCKRTEECAVKITQHGDTLLIEVEPEGHDAKIMSSGKLGFFGRREMTIKGKLYRVQVLGYVLKGNSEAVLSQNHTDH